MNSWYILGIINEITI